MQQPFALIVPASDVISKAWQRSYAARRLRDRRALIVVAHQALSGINTFITMMSPGARHARTASHVERHS
jgi:hypothetical protein